MIGKKTELAISVISKRVDVFTGRQELVGCAKVHAHTVGNAFAVKWLGSAVARQCQRFERDPYAIAIAVAIIGWKIAIDAMTDLLPFCADTDRFGDAHAGIGRNGNLAVKIENTLVGVRASHCQQTGEHYEQTHQYSHVGASCAPSAR